MPCLHLFLFPVTTCCSSRWRTDKLSAAVAGTAILSYPFSFYRIIYHQRSRSLLHSAKRPGATALDQPVPLDLSFSCSRLQVSRRYEFLRSMFAIRSFSPYLATRTVLFFISLIRDRNFITGGMEDARAERSLRESNRSIYCLLKIFFLPFNARVDNERVAGK